MRVLQASITSKAVSDLLFGMTETNWKSRLKWFAAEFLVVVTGVLVALSVQSNHDRREERKLERVYLRQLASDLRETEARIQRNVHEDSLTIGKALGMLRFFRSSGPLPPVDSLTHWASISTPTLDLVTGTLTSLTQTGDIRLIQDDSLRASILGYVAFANAIAGRVALSQERAALHSATRTRQMVEYLPETDIKVPSGENESTYWWRFVDYSALRRDKEAESAFQSYVFSRGNNLTQVRSLVAPTRDLRERIESKIARD